MKGFTVSRVLRKKIDGDTVLFGGIWTKVPK